MNILSAAKKGASDLLAVIRAANNEPTTIYSAADTVPVKGEDGILRGGLPPGFFITQYPNGRTTLGYNDRHLGYNWDVPEEFVHPLTKKLTKPDKPRAALPVFKLSLRYTQVDGMARIGNHLVFDTETGQWGGAVGYERHGGGRHEPMRDDLSNGLWGGGGSYGGYCK